MRITINKIAMFLVTSFVLTACYKNEVTLYDGPSQIHFMGSEDMIIVNQDEAIIEIEVGVTKVQDTEQVFNIVVDTENSSAEENVHFKFISKTIVVPAGEALANIQIQGIYENAVEEGATLTLHLGAEKDENVATFDNEFQLNLFRHCDFDRRMFTGKFHVTEKASDGTYNYEVTMRAGSGSYSVLSKGLWMVEENEVELQFDRNSYDVSIPDAFFFEDLGSGYENVWIKSLQTGMYNSCLGTIFEIEYFIYPKATPDTGYDRGTFTFEKIGN
ncbi:hypothetical protein [Saccharicrinis aurantiacus]|uniref:hypothetical protein n=1 Tax=Saccharicrinis aurantiacus TaxID=1849719 RepID=UPI0024913F9B|nr:hypothetical protein [Saccharicrinis aurantiacus]